MQNIVNKVIDLEKSAQKHDLTEEELNSILAQMQTTFQELPFQDMCWLVQLLEDKMDF